MSPGTVIWADWPRVSFSPELTWETVFYESHQWLTTKVSICWIRCHVATQPRELSGMASLSPVPIQSSVP